MAWLYLIFSSIAHPWPVEAINLLGIGDSAIDIFLYSFPPPTILANIILMGHDSIAFCSEATERNYFLLILLKDFLQYDQIIANLIRYHIMVILIILCHFSQQSYCSLNENFHSEKFWVAVIQIWFIVLLCSLLYIHENKQIFLKNYHCCGSKIMSVLFPYLCICTFSTMSMHQNVLWIHFFF